MGLSLREWLIIGGAVIVALIVLDGWRRMRGNRNTLKMNIDRSLADLPEESHNPELPGGGFRIIDPAGQVTDAGGRKEPEFSFEPGNPSAADSAAPAAAQEASLNVQAEPEVALRATNSLGSADPHDTERDPLFEALDDFDSLSEGVSAVRIIRQPAAAEDSASHEGQPSEPERSAGGANFTAADTPKAHHRDYETHSNEPEQGLTEAVETHEQRCSAAEVPRTGDGLDALTADQADSVEEDDLDFLLPDEFSQNPEGVSEAEELADSDLDLSKPVTELMRKPLDVQPEPQQEAMELGREAARTQDTAGDAFIDRRSRQDALEPDNVLVISVVAPQGRPSFQGDSLLQILLACGMQFGDMQIFHRCEDGIDKGAIQFSMANALEPGYFDIDNMDSFATRGVTFFMSMDEPQDVMNAYECMLATAEAVAKNLQGELLDENHSTMRSQTKEHYRERIRKFEMRKLKQQS